MKINCKLEDDEDTPTFILVVEDPKTEFAVTQDSFNPLAESIIDRIVYDTGMEDDELKSLQIVLNEAFMRHLYTLYNLTIAAEKTAAPITYIEVNVENGYAWGMNYILQDGRDYFDDLTWIDEYKVEFSISKRCIYIKIRVIIVETNEDDPEVENILICFTDEACKFFNKYFNKNEN